MLQENLGKWKTGHGAKNSEQNKKGGGVIGSLSAAVTLMSVLFCRHVAGQARKKKKPTLVKIGTQLFVMVFMCTYFTDTYELPSGQKTLLPDCDTVQ